MIYERALVTFVDGHQIDIPLTAGPRCCRSWAHLCKVACEFALENTGKRYAIEDVASVRIREGSGDGAH